MKTLFILLVSILATVSLCSQSKTDSIQAIENSTNQKAALIQESGEIPKTDFERPFNFFAAAGASYRFLPLYDVAVSPVDYTIQFEGVSFIHTRFSMGLVWNPFLNNSEENINAFINKIRNAEKKELVNSVTTAARNHTAVSLLINIAQLTFSSSDINTSSPIDVGFGVGYRNDKFLILGTLEFTPVRTPREYFINKYKDNDLTFTLSGAEEPLRIISVEDNNLFTNKIFSFIGVKIAYAFTEKQN